MYRAFFLKLLSPKPYIVASVGMYGMKKILEKCILIVKVVGELLFLYGFLGWIYGVLVQLTHPHWLSLELSHLTPWLRVDAFTILSFIVSAVGFFMWRLTSERVRSVETLRPRKGSASA